MSWNKVKLRKVLRQYRIEHWVQDDKMYKQVSILNEGIVVLRGEKMGKEIGRKRQFLIDINKYPNTLIFTRQLLLQGCIGMAPNEVNGCIVTENMPMFSIEGIEPDFLLFYLNTELFKEQVRNLETSGTAQKSLHERQFLELYIPLPSVKEQKEIIANYKLTKNNLEKIDLEISLQQIYLQQLRQSILQEAVQGKFALQNTTDEPASKLLERIKAEKQKLIAAGKLKKEKELPPITENEILFELPKGWVWCKLSDIAYVGNGSTPDKKEFTESSIDIPYLKVYNIVKQKVNFNYKPQYIKAACHNGQLKRSITNAGDVLMNIVGPPLGKVAIVPEEIKECNINQAIVVIKPFVKEFNQWIYWFLCEQTAISAIVTKGTAGQDNISVTQSRNLVFPLPPLSEQHRIVTKVQHLMLMANQLKQQLQQSSEYGQQLLQSVLNEAFEQKIKVYEMKEK